MSPRSSWLHGPELVFAVVRPVGTPDADFHAALEAGLNRYGYGTEVVKLSALLADRAAAAGKPVPARPEDARVKALMDEGDDLCATTGLDFAVALLGVNRIREIRLDRASAAGDPNVQLANVPVPRLAYVIDSIKRPAEVAHLRAIYGDHVIVVGLQASPATRSASLSSKLAPQRATKPSDIDPAVQTLLERDHKEAAKGGQNTLRAFPMADVFVDVDGDAAWEVNRLLDLLFANPSYRAPTAAEFGMNVAQVSSTRSSELGLKVGAALLLDDHTVVSVGVNAHPRVAGSPAYDSSAVDIRELLANTLRLLPPGTLADGPAGRLADDEGRFIDELLDGPLSTSKIRDLTEFQVPVHAEMNALLDAIKRGVPVTGATVYVTAYPCHTCTKHLLALGLPVRYLEPYPKSRAAAMYGTAVQEQFLPFTGIAPRRYAALFRAVDDRKNPDGSRISWTNVEMKKAMPQVDPFVDPRGVAEREAKALAELPSDRAPGDTPPSGLTAVGGVRKDEETPQAPRRATHSSE